MGFVEGLESNLKNANVVTGIPGLDNEKLTGIAAYNSDVLLELYTAWAYNYSGLISADRKAPLFNILLSRYY